MKILNLSKLKRFEDHKLNVAEKKLIIFFFQVWKILREKEKILDTKIISFSSVF